VNLAYLLHCVILLLAFICSYRLDHAELELAEPMEQAQVEEFTNLVWIKASPSASHHIPWILFVLNHYNYVLLDCAFKFIGIVLVP
jgi:hypothetical protein